jgi:uncharacterized protein YciI
MTMGEYIVFLAPKRETFPADGTPEELKIVDQHFEYLKSLLAEGRLILAGRCQDGPPGIVVFEAEDIKAAQVLIENDPAVKAGIFHAELRPYRVALMRES